MPMKKEITQAKIDALALEIIKEFAKEGEVTTLEEAQEMAKMELNEKANRRYEKADAPRKKSTRERKVDEVKKKFINGFRIYLEGSGAKVEPLTNETDLHFTYLGESYSVKLSKHRPKK
jgi:hypothetical protein